MADHLDPGDPGRDAAQAGAVGPVDLYAFFGRDLLGVFHPESAGETAEGAQITATFEYLDADRARQTPVSLSLPRAGDHAPGAAYAFLDNLLPDRSEVRQRWAHERDLADVDPFTLLSAYGEDVAGALSLSTDPQLPAREPEPLLEATTDDIAARVATLTRETTSWNDPRVRPRMSLAGAQGKFTLARIGDQWFWPTYEYPSTHILKPPSREHRRVELYEHLGLELARSVGVEAARSQVTEFGGQPTFLTERWDRAHDERGGVRLHAEDLNQALGNPTARKYDTALVGAPQLARLLADYGMERRFVRQLAFNAGFGNADAHAKNYSVLLAGTQVVLAPIYDTVPTFLWPHFDQRFAMPIGKAHLPAELDEKNWRSFAHQAGIDADVVCEEAFTITARLVERYEDLFAEGGADPTRLRAIRKRMGILRRNLPNTSTAAPTDAAAGPVRSVRASPTRSVDLQQSALHHPSPPPPQPQTQPQPPDSSSA